VGGVDMREDEAGEPMTMEAGEPGNSLRQQEQLGERECGWIKYPSAKQ